MQAGKECVCAQSLDNATQALPQSACNYTCWNDQKLSSPTQTRCGGVGLMNVYCFAALVQSCGEKSLSTIFFSSSHHVLSTTLGNIPQIQSSIFSGSQSGSVNIGGGGGGGGEGQQNSGPSSSTVKIASSTTVVFVVVWVIGGSICFRNSRRKRRVAEKVKVTPWAPFEGQTTDMGRVNSGDGGGGADGSKSKDVTAESTAAVAAIANSKIMGESDDENNTKTAGGGAVKEEPMFAPTPPKGVKLLYTLFQRNKKEEVGVNGSEGENKKKDLESNNGGKQRTSTTSTGSKTLKLIGGIKVLKSSTASKVLPENDNDKEAGGNVYIAARNSTPSPQTLSHDSANDPSVGVVIGANGAGTGTGVSFSSSPPTATLEQVVVVVDNGDGDGVVVPSPFLLYQPSTAIISAPETPPGTFSTSFTSSSSSPPTPAAAAASVILVQSSLPAPLLLPRPTTTTNNAVNDETVPAATTVINVSDCSLPAKSGVTFGSSSRRKKKDSLGVTGETRSVSTISTASAQGIPPMQGVIISKGEIGGGFSGDAAKNNTALAPLQQHDTTNGIGGQDTIQRRLKKKKSFIVAENYNDGFNFASPESIINSNNENTHNNTSIPPTLKKKKSKKSVHIDEQVLQQLEDKEAAVAAAVTQRVEEEKGILYNSRVSTSTTTKTGGVGGGGGSSRPSMARKSLTAAEDANDLGGGGVLIPSSLVGDYEDDDDQEELVRRQQRRRAASTSSTGSKSRKKSSGGNVGETIEKRKKSSSISRTGGGGGGVDAGVKASTLTRGVSTTTRFRAIMSYTPDDDNHNEDEDGLGDNNAVNLNHHEGLVVNLGDELTVWSMEADHRDGRVWFLGSNGISTGRFPASCVSEIKE